ncbi:MAG: metal ABC transporter ATP-binding protein [Candidatus Thermoplasmatota archaeon]|nr:metal ABC transporter ATP-binding protein [Candidatus Thermoplasmatota archaeon]
MEIIACQNQVLEVSNLSVIRSGTQVIHDINLSVSCGEFIGIVGPNGGGKSTLLLTILGILKPNTGTIRIFDHEPMSKNVIGKIGWVPQTASNLSSNVQITVRELIQLGTLKNKSYFQIYRKKNRELVEKIIGIVGLEEVANTRLSSLSGGQRQRAAIGKALASEAEIIVMDEPMVGVDRESRNSLLKLLDNLCHEENKTILMVSHDLSTIKQTVHRMVYLEETIRYDGSTSEFPDLSSLAKLRGITSTHNEYSSTKSKSDKDKKSDPITIVFGKEGV